MENTKRTPLGDVNSITTSTPPKRLYSKSKQTPTSVQATNDNRCSVEKLSQWLENESAKKQQPIVRSNTSNGSTPLRFRTTPKLKAAEVQATNERRVSVKTLSTWMNDDPYEKNKKGPIRRGARVIAKSRIFEKQTNNIGFDIQVGSVQNKQDWLKEAFKTDRTDANTATKRSLPSSTEASSSQMKKKRESPEKEVFNTVKDKKEWLAGAFKHNDGGNTPNVEVSKSVEGGDNDNVMSISEHVVATSATNNGKTTYLNEDKEDNSSSDVVSVANRAEWLKSAFDKK